MRPALSKINGRFLRASFFPANLDLYANTNSAFSECTANLVDGAYIFVAAAAGLAGVGDCWGYPPFILPGPGDVWQQFLVVVGDGRLLKHSLVTISEVIPGLLIGCLIAMPLGYFHCQISPR